MNLDDLLVAVRNTTPGPRKDRVSQQFGQRLHEELVTFFSNRFDSETSETLVQQTLVVLFEVLPNYERRGEDSLAHYVTKIAANKARAWVQERQRKRMREEKYSRMHVSPSPLATPSSWVLSEHERALFHAYKDELLPHERRVIEHDLAGGDDRAYAAEHGIALDTVRTHRRRAKLHLCQIHEARRKTPLHARDTPPLQS